MLSDIHLGSNRNTTQEIITNLRTYFKDNHKLFKKLHLIILAGDVFDKLLSSSSDEYILAVEWLTELVMYCKHNNIIETSITDGDHQPVIYPGFICLICGETWEDFSNCKFFN